jgi:adenosylmethionine-8-amino-7-oxononanoate aminotransferase
VANASLTLLLESSWQARIEALERGLTTGLAPCRDLPGVAEVRVLGAIGVVELREPVAMARLQPALVEAGVWVRPFGRLVYLMPPYIMDDADLASLCRAVHRVLARP